MFPFLGWGADPQKGGSAHSALLSVELPLNLWGICNENCSFLTCKPVEFSISRACAFNCAGRVVSEHIQERCNLEGLLARVPNKEPSRATLQVKCEDPGLSSAHATWICSQGLRPSSRILLLYPRYSPTDNCGGRLEQDSNGKSGPYLTCK